MIQQRKFNFIILALVVSVFFYLSLIRNISNEKLIPIISIEEANNLKEKIVVSNEKAVYLNETVVNLNEANKILEKQLKALLDKNEANKSPRIFCLILTTESLLSSWARSIYDTWVYRCDGHAFVTTLSNKTTNMKSSREDGMLRIKYREKINVFQPPFYKTDTYKLLTKKVLHSFMAISESNGDYDWYLKCDTDTFIFYDNMLSFLKDKNPRFPITYGYNFKVIVKDGYHSGGAGYLLSNEAFTRLTTKLNNNRTFCSGEAIEDADVAKCLRELDVIPGDTMDAYGRERFHPLSIWHHYEGSFPDWLIKNSKFRVQAGFNCCSDETISFHYVPNEMSNLAESIPLTKPFVFKEYITEMYKKEKINITSIKVKEVQKVE